MITNSFQRNIKSEKGSGSIIGICIIFLITSFMLSISILAKAIYDNQRIQNSADFAALAGINEFVNTNDINYSCLVAKKIAMENNSKSQQCNLIDKEKLEIIVFSKTVFNIIIKKRAVAGFP